MSSNKSQSGVSMQRGEGELYILSAPSGAGKSTLIQRLLDSPIGKDGSLRFSVSHTTRTPRRGERDGSDYHFVTREAFEGMVEDHAFLEWAQVHDNLYGTALTEVGPYLARGIDVILDIDVQGAAQVLADHPEAQGIFLLPPGYRVLEQRLRRRGLDAESTIDRRLGASLEEIAQFPRYGHVIINDEVDRAAEALIAVVLSRRHGVVRMRGQIEKIIENFRSNITPK